MFRCDAVTREELDASPSKLGDVAVIEAALGTTRRIIAKRSATATKQEDVWANGTVFRDVGNTGAFKSASGKIIGIGRIKGATVQAAADMSTGLSVLRIYGTGAKADRWIELTIGKLGKNPAPDIVTRDHFTATNGFNVDATFGISGKRLKPSGTGPAAPSLTPDSPHSVELWDWSNVNTPVLVGTIYFDNRIDDMVMQDAEVAASLGDVRVTHCTNSIVFGEYEFGAVYYSAHTGANGEANKPLDQVLCAFKPHNRWSSWPFENTFNAAVDGTFPTPFKAVLKRLDGTKLHTFEMYSTRVNEEDGTGWPINDPRFGQGNEPPPLGLHPGFNMAEMLPWQSHMPSLSLKADKFYPGTTAQSRRPSMAKQGWSSNGTNPLAWNRYQGDSMNHWYAAPRWPLGATSDSEIPINGRDPEDAFGDPYLFNYNVYNGWAGRVSRITGWDHEPGAVGTHDWLTGPGGVRFDRHGMPSPLALFMSDKNGVRLKGNVPLRKMVNSYGLNMFSHSCHYVTDVKTFATQPDEYGFKGLASYGQAYYGYRMDYAEHMVGLRGIPAGSDWPSADKDGRHHYNGWALDNQHAYTAPGWWAILFNSPMHVYASKMRYHAVSMCQLGAVKPDQAANGGFLHRQYAWRFLQQVVAWKLATEHSHGLNREGIEARFQVELESVYNAIWKPIYIDNSQSLRHQGLKRFGLGAELKQYSIETPPESGNYTHYHYMGAETDSKSMYLAQALVLMKQCGMWKAMRERSQLCAQMLDFIIECMDRTSIEWLHFTKGRGEGGYIGAKLQSEPLGEMPANWEDWAAKNPRNGATDFFHNADGSWKSDFEGEDATSQLYFQYVFARRDFFPEKPHPHLNSVISLIQGWLDEKAAIVAAAPTPRDKTNADFGYGHPSHGILNAPTELGPV